VSTCLHSCDRTFSNEGAAVFRRTLDLLVGISHFSSESVAGCSFPASIFRRFSIHFCRFTWFRHSTILFALSTIKITTSTIDHTITLTTSIVFFMGQDSQCQRSRMSFSGSRARRGFLSNCSIRLLGDLLNDLHMKITDTPRFSNLHR
jgi:hypothetical protein